MKRSKKKLSYQEGDWFAVPIQPGGYGVGLVARAPGNGVILGYFFGTRYWDLPTEANLRELSRTDAILVTLFGDTGLVQGHWPIIARKSPWNQEEWPLPAFGRIFELEGQELAWRVEYSSADLVTEVRETRVKPEQIRHLPKDTLSGHLALQEHLADLLAK
jgi:hypothetical protein